MLDDEIYRKDWMPAYTNHFYFEIFFVHIFNIQDIT